MTAPSRTVANKRHGRERVEGRRRCSSRIRVDLDGHGLGSGARREVRADHEVVHRDREDHDRARYHRRHEQRQEHHPQRIDGGGAEVHRSLLEVLADREQPTANDDDDERDREGDVSYHLGRRTEANRGEQVREDEEERDAHDDLRRDEREQRDESRSARSPAAPAGETDRERNTDRYRYEDGKGRELQALLQRVVEIRIVHHGEIGIAPVPSGRPALGRRARPSVIEGETDRDQDRDDRPGEIASGDDPEEAGPPPGVPEPGSRAVHASPYFRIERVVTTR